MDSDQKNESKQPEEPTSPPKRQNGNVAEESSTQLTPEGERPATSGEDITREVTMEERFPTKPVVPTAGVFVQYNPTTAASKLANISSLNTTERLTYIKHLTIILKQLGGDGIGLLKKFFEDIMKDRDDIKSALLKQVPDLIGYFETLPNAYQLLKDYIVPLLVSFLHMSQPNIKQEAGQYLASVSHKLNDKDRGECVLKHVIEMAHDDSNEDNRIVAVQLFSKMADSFGRDLCEQFIGLELLSLGEDSHLKVRQEAIINLPIISREVSQSFFKNRFFKFYQKKSGETHWGIRKSCVDIIIHMAEICDEVTRQTQLTEIMLAFIRDTHKWVKISAYKNIGPFIATLKGRVINQKLLESYMKMSTHQINDLSLENEIFYSCAYNFPAVLVTLGAPAWETLFPTYQRLLKVPDKKIKKTLASSLHEVAKIIGEQNTRNYLFTILDSFLKDNSKMKTNSDDEIKLGAIQHLSEIIQILDEQKRQQLIDIFLALQKDQKKWRIRQAIAQQLTTLATIYNVGTVFVYIVPMAFKFCTDTVALVRDEAAAKIGDIVKQFTSKAEGEIYLPAIIQNIKGFSNSKKFTQRQTFATMCETLIGQTKLFEDNFLKHLQELAQDKVVNVRIAVAKVVSTCLAQKSQIGNNAVVQSIVQTLRKDASEQVTEMFVDL